MLVTVILLVVLVQIFQTIGMLIANKLDKRDCRNGKGYDGGCGSIAFSYQKSGEWNEQDQQDQEWDASENICDHIQDLI